MSRTRLAALHYVTAAASTVVTTLASMLATRIVLRALGDEPFGAYRVTQEWIGYLTLFDLGVGPALYPLFARAAVADETTRASGEPAPSELALNVALRAYVRITAAMAAAIVVLMIFLPRLLHVGGGLAADLRWGCVLVMGGLIVTPLGPFRAFIEARQRGYRVNVLIMLQGLATAVLGILAAYAGLGVAGQLGAITVGQLPIPILLMVDAIRGKGAGFMRRVIRLPVDRAMWRELWSLNWYLLIVQTCSRVSFMSDAIILGMVRGPTVVVPLVLTQRPMGLAQTQVFAIGNATWAGLVELRARGEIERFHERFIEITRLCAVFGGAIIAPLIAFNHRLIGLWVGPNQFAGDWTNAIIGFNSFFQGIFSLWAWMFNGSGATKRLIPLYLASALVNVGASWVGAHQFGIIGPVLGTLVANVAVLLWGFPWLLARCFGISPWALGGAVLRPLLLGTAFAAAMHYALTFHAPGGWLLLLTEMSIAGALYLALAYLFVFGSAQREALRARVGFALRRTT